MRKSTAVMRDMTNVTSVHFTNVVHLLHVDLVTASEMTLKPGARRHNRNQNAILHMARRMVAEGGVENLSMRTLAEALDYSPSALYKYFDSKEDLLKTIALHGLDELAAVLRTAVESEETFPDRLRAAGQAYLAFAYANPQLYAVMFSVVLPGSHPSGGDAPPADDAFRVMMDLFEAGIRAGAFKARPGYGAVEMAFHAWITVHGIVTLRAANRAPQPLFDLAAARILQAMVDNMER